MKRFRQVCIILSLVLFFLAYIRGLFLVDDYGMGSMLGLIIAGILWIAPIWAAYGIVLLIKALTRVTKR